MEPIPYNNAIVVVILCYLFINENSVHTPKHNCDMRKGDRKQQMSWKDEAEMKTAAHSLCLHRRFVVLRYPLLCHHRKTIQLHCCWCRWWWCFFSTSSSKLQIFAPLVTLFIHATSLLLLPLTPTTHTPPSLASCSPHQQSEQSSFVVCSDLRLLAACFCVPGSSSKSSQTKET